MGAYHDGMRAIQDREDSRRLADPHVSLLFIDFENPNRLRLQGRAAVRDADLAVRVEVDRIWPNCPRYIHKMRMESLSPHAPREGHEPPEAEWKQFFTDVLPRK